MIARDELARLMFVADNSNQPEAEALADWAAYISNGRDTYTHLMADALLAAGYSKPRTITTVEELDALPDRSLIETRGQIVFQKYDDWFAKGENGWVRPGYEWTERTRNFDDKVHQPLTVIHTPKES